MKAAAVCCALSLLIVLLAVTDARPRKSRWRREIDTNTTTTTTTESTGTIEGPADNGTCPTVPYCDTCIHDNAECVYCPVGTVYSSDHKSCVSCVMYCDVCHLAGTGTDGLDLTECDQCRVSYALDSEKKCQYCGSELCIRCNISTDADGQLLTKHLECVEKAHLINDECVGCPDYCDTCTIVAEADGTLTKTCSKCMVGYGFQGGSTCLRCPDNCLACDSENGKCDSVSCVDGYARSGTTGLCEPCGQYCYKCQTSAGPGKCDSGSCYSNVTEAYVNVPHLYPVIYVSSSQTCDKCSEFCTSCTTPAQCDVCVEGYYRNDQATCTSCMSNCRTCTSGTDCTACEEGYVKSTSTTGTVSCEACPRKCSQCADTPHPVKTTELLCEVCTYRHQLTSVATCDACPLNCLQCTWDGTCTSCESGYVISNGECRQCPQYCTQCTADANGITSCVSNMCTSTETGQGRVVYNGQCELCPDYCTLCTVTSTGTKECQYSACQNNSAWLPGEKTCKACPPNCAGYCTISPKTGETFCEECLPGYTRNDAGTCEACPANCDRCFWDGSSTQCYLSGCKERYYEKLLNPAKFTNTELASTCSAINVLNCLIASPTPYFDSDAGLCEKCMPGYVNTTTGCQSCVTNCETCVLDADAPKCELCSADSTPVLDAAGLITSCKACGVVASGCQACTSDVCTTCGAGYILHSEAQCIACSDQADSQCSISSNALSTISCAAGYTETNDGCQHCPDGCSSCTFAGNTGKTTCNTCYPGYYLDSGTNICAACSSVKNCETCSSADQCLTCPSRYYLDNGECKACMSNCDSCSSQTTCNTCTKGTSYNKDTSGTYTCTRCTIYNCASCSTGAESADPGQCTTCDDGYITTGTACLRCPDGCTSCQVVSGQAVCNYGQCSMGYVMAAISGNNVECRSCGTGCATCHIDSSDSVVCDACLIDDISGTSYYLSNGACSKVTSCRYVNSSLLCDGDGCDVGFGRKNSFPTSTCEACPAGCQSCYYDGSAMKCYSGRCNDRYVYYDGSCYACPANCVICSKNSSALTCTQCSEGYAINSGESTCSPCGSGCAACSNSVNVTLSCTRCSESYLLQSATCSACAAQCLTCTTSGADGCDENGCESGYGRMYYSSDNITCEACPDGCLQCDGNPSQCEVGQCKSGYLRKDDGLCYPCAGNCTTCTTENTCALGGCFAYFGRKQQNDGNITCEQCPSNCLRCDTDTTKCDDDMCEPGYVKDASSGLCTMIDCTQAGAILSGGSCQAPISNCMVGVAGGSSCPQGACKLSTVWNNGQCIGCPSNCLSCKLRPDGTTACHNNGCKRGFGVKPDGSCLACPNQCDECEYDGVKMVCITCNEKNFGLVPANTCLQCPVHCTSCSELNQVIQCSACEDGYILHPDTKLCVQCPLHCQTCIIDAATLSTRCTVCQEYYSLSSSYSCDACSTGCMKCDETVGTDACDPLWCATGYVQGPTGACHACPGDCPDRCWYNEASTSGVYVSCYQTREFYLDGGVLRRCDSSGDGSCDQCSDSSTCLQTGCQEGYTWNRFTCEKKHTDYGTGNAFCVGFVCPECLDGYYMTTQDADPNQRTCKPCDDPNCQQCIDNTGSSRCTVCKTNYYLDVEYNCIACPVDKNCVNCNLVGTDVKCTTCPSGYYLYDTTGTCIECFASPCSQCDSTKDSDAKVCTACIDGYFLNTTTKTCNACNTTCATCTDSSKCVTCKEGYILDSTTKYCFKCPDVNANNCELKDGYDSLILTDGCISGYAVSTDRKSCLKCPDDCVTCNSNLTCSACATGFSLNTDQCGRCPLNCQSCSAKMDSDKRLTLSCDVCDDEYALYSDGLCYACPPNCAECTAENSGTETPTVTCTRCTSNLYGLKNGLCESCDTLTTANCYTCEPVASTDNSTTTAATYMCQSCQGNYVLSLDNQTCLSCDSVNCGVGGACGAYSLCSRCQDGFTQSERNCTINCYKCEKGQGCRHIDDDWENRSGMETVECNGPCFFYTQYPINGDKEDRVSWYGCADVNYTVLNYEATYNDKMKALECKGKEGQPETCVYTCAYEGCNPGDTASTVAPLVSLLIMAIITSVAIQQN